MTLPAYVAFAAFGAFWGVWGASVPRVQDQAGVDDGALGVALLFIGAGALPAMLLAGRALDRWGLRVAAVTIAALGVAATGLALTAVNLPALCLALTVVGAVSGAADVAMNSVAGRAEQAAARPVITRAHGVFSTMVVAGSLTTGLTASLPLVVPFALVMALSLAAAAALRATLAAHRPQRTAAPPPRRRLLPLLLIGTLGALAFATENAHQSWSAVFAHDELGAGVGLSAIAPAIFAGTVAVTRFAAGALPSAYARTVLLGGALAAGSGTALLAVAPTLPTAAAALALAAAGTAVLFPTLVGIVSRNVDESYRGRATSIITTVSYLGFIVGPVYVGLWSEGVGLRGAMLAVAALAAALFLLTPLLLRSAYGPRSTS